MTTVPTPTLPLGQSPTPTSDADATLFRYRFDNVDFDESTNVLQVAGAAVPVEPLPLQLLGELLRRPNEVVTRAELFEALWDGRPTVDHVLANAVAKLRRALGDAGAARIVNLPRVGYRFSGAVERVAMGRRQSAPVAFTAGEPVPGREDFRFERALGAPGAASQSVWLASNAKLQVARVFKFAADGERLAALKREYTVYRVLRHELGERTDFAQVVGVNFAQAPYFIECEYGGEDLPRWAAAGNHLAALNTAERIALFLQIARAVAAAHSVGVLHKDLKPANVLIDAGSDGWVARLTDFGISRLLDPEQLARLGVTAMGMTVTSGAHFDSPAGTLLYLAPELLAGQSATMRSDLYALGLVLYQLLVGDFRRPLSTGWEREIDDELLRADIAAATEGQPEDRLAGVAELIERLETLDARRSEHLERRRAAQLAAHLTSRMQRSQARRPWVIAAFMSLGIGFAASLWFYTQARSALQRAEQDSARAQSINDFLNKDVLQSADVIRVGTTKTISMVDVLNRASVSVAERFKGQPETQASVHQQLGDVYLRMNYKAEAETEYERAIALLLPLVPADHSTLLALRFSVARTRVGLYMPKVAMERLDAAERAAGGRRSWADDRQLELLATRTRVEVLMDADRDKDALPIALHLVALSDLLASSELSQRFDARQHLAELYARLGETSKASALLAEIMKPPYAEGAVGEVLYANAKLLLARERINQNKYDEAQLLLTQVRDTLTRSFGPNEMHVGVANSELADLHQLRGDFKNAALATRAAITAFSASLGDGHSFTHISKVNLAINELNAGAYASALRELDALRPEIAKSKRLETALAGLDFARAQALAYLGRPAEALALLNSINADFLMESSWGARDWQWKLQAEKGRAAAALGRHAEGLALLKSAVAEMRKVGTAPWELERYEKMLAAASR